MTLPAVLEALAVRLPGRVKLTRGNVDVHEGGNWVHVGYLPPAGPLLLHRLEYALREEIEARGWTIQLNTSNPPDPCRVSVETPKWFYPAYADTPAHALCLALLSALEEAEGE